MAMSESSPDVERIAKEYLEGLDQGLDEKRRGELEDTLKDLKDRREQYAEQHGADSGIIQRLDRKIEEVKTELEEFYGASEEVDELRAQLLEAARERFELNDEWLTSTVLRALTHALYNEKDDFLYIDRTHLDDSTDVSDIDEIDKIDLEHTLLLLVEDQLGQTDTVRKRWERFSDSNSYLPFQVLAQEESAAPEDVLPELDDGTGRKDVKNWLEGPLYKWDDLVPYYRVGDGEFALSTSGKYFAHNYAQSADEVPEDEGEATKDGEAGNGDRQLNFDDVDTSKEVDTDE